MTTESFRLSDTVGSLVVRRPALSRVFEKAGIDYCCGGKKTLEEACRIKGLNPRDLLAMLEGFILASGEAPVVDVTSLPLFQLVDHIEMTHHVFLHEELPRLDYMTQKVAAVHGDGDARLSEVRKTFLELVKEMIPHLKMEEETIFPQIRQLDSSSPHGSLTTAIHQLESEHDRVGAALAELRRLTDGYTPPEWACNTYRAMLDLLARLERDMHQHVHKENNVLFPRALEMKGSGCQLGDENEPYCTTQVPQS